LPAPRPVGPRRSSTSHLPSLDDEVWGRPRMKRPAAVPPCPNAPTASRSLLGLRCGTPAWAMGKPLRCGWQRPTRVDTRAHESRPGDIRAGAAGTRAVPGPERPRAPWPNSWVRNGPRAAVASSVRGRCCEPTVNPSMRRSANGPLNAEVPGPQSGSSSAGYCGGREHRSDGDPGPQQSPARPSPPDPHRRGCGRRVFRVKARP